VFVRCGLDHLGEVHELDAFLFVDEVGQTLRPCVLKLYQHFYELHVVLQLRIHHLYVLFVFSEQVSKVLERVFYLLSQVADSFRLERRHLSESILCIRQDLNTQIVSSHSFRIRHRVYLSKDFH
jgi:hypothetical protein